MVIKQFKMYTFNFVMMHNHKHLIIKKGETITLHLTDYIKLLLSSRILY